MTPDARRRGIAEQSRRFDHVRVGVEHPEPVPHDSYIRRAARPPSSGIVVPLM